MTREEEIKQAARNYFDEYMDGLKGKVLTVQQTFEEAAKWADKTMIERVCNWLKQSEDDYYKYDAWKGDYVDFNELIKDIKKTMEL